MNRFPQRGVRDLRYKYILNLHPERKWTTHFTLVPGIPDSHKEVWDTWIAKAETDRGAARLIDLIEAACGKRAIREMKPMQAGDVRETFADISAIERDLGFHPTTSIGEGVPAFVRWFRDYHGI